MWIIAGAMLLAMPLAARASAQVLTTSLREDLTTTDPSAYLGLTGSRLLGLVYEGLSAVTPEGRIMPALATRWEVFEQGRLWRFHLRPGVRFHSGRPLTVADVQRSVEAVLASRSPGIGVLALSKLEGARAFTDGRAERLAGFTPLDALSFELRFTEPVGTFAHHPLLIFDSGAEREGGAGWFAHQSGGTGPFRLDGWTRGREVTLSANPDHWGGAPPVTGLRFRLLPDVETALRLFDTGTLDFVSVPESALRRVLADPVYRERAVATPRAQVRYLGLNQSLYPPFRDRRVRAAIAHALDRAAVAQGLYGGAAHAAAGLVSPGVGGHTDGVLDRPYRPDEARRLLAEAGYPEGRGLPPVELTAPESARDEAAYYADQLRRVLGLPVRVRTLERAAFGSAANAATLGMFLSGWTADYPDALTYLEPMWHSRSPYNQSCWRDETVDRWIDEAVGTVDDAARHRLSQAIEQRLLEEAAAVPLPVPMNVLLRHASAAAVAVDPFGFLSVGPRRRGP
ncbi:ABC transporter substrate-binding protein [Azospirillum argentinense]|uniref:ABC transporter substrate-binding protein n=1 Tax=Azospirillum argentinense TaxID=2970906 RepID=UPI00068E7AED|nr:ABC transporter substrate-binding protein [Azospirillum argentinense]